jgi:acetyl-CoA carboxylase carboxyltransferase component
VRDLRELLPESARRACDVRPLAGRTIGVLANNPIRKGGCLDCLSAAEHERDALLGRLTEDHARVAGGVDRAMTIGVLGEVISPRQTRRRLAEAFAAAPTGRGHHGNIPL